MLSMIARGIVFLRVVIGWWRLEVEGWRLGDSRIAMKSTGKGCACGRRMAAALGGRRATPYSVSAGSGGGDSEKGCAEKKQFGS